MRSVALHVVAALSLSLPHAAASSAIATTAKRLAEGACLRMACDMSGGLPLEHWKLRLVRPPGGVEETPWQALRAVGQDGGMGAYWRGTPAKLVEGSTGGAMLFAGKECAASLLKHTPVLKLLPAPLGAAISGDIEIAEEECPRCARTHRPLARGRTVMPVKERHGSWRS